MFIQQSGYQDELMVKISAFYDASFATPRTDEQTDRIPKINTSLIGRGKWEFLNEGQGQSSCHQRLKFYP